MKTELFVAVMVSLIVAMACAPKRSSESYDRVERHLFNRTAVRLNLPLYWIADNNGDGAVQPDEVTSLLFYSRQIAWTAGGAFTPDFDEAYARIEAEASGSTQLPDDLAPTELERRQLVLEDLDHGIPTLVHNDLRMLAEDHKSFVRHMLRAGDLIDELYAEQNGTGELVSSVPDDDLASQSLFRRNRGPACVAPMTYENPACSAVPGAPKPLCGMYPAGLQSSSDFCEAIADNPAAELLMNPFTAVRERDGELHAIPLTEAFTDLTSAIATELRAAASALQDPGEDALRSYLLAAAQSFTDNQWEPADEEWAAMNARNSRWYLRVAPDEVYWEPCALKAGVHLTFALINTASLEWQDRLTPVRQQMEDELAALIGAPYAARTVGFQLPDFIDIVINAGDDRVPLGATIGQSLPNVGPVANEGRGRTVAMSNLYTDPDSQEIRAAQAESLLSAETMQAFTSDPMPGLLSTILHEAAHNLGPAHEYTVNSKTDTEIFGGGLASTMEELKAQSTGLWLIDFLAGREIITQELARQTYVDCVIWAFGHISRGMYTAGGQRKAYSQLAAIQVGQLLEHGALRFDPDAVAANGEDRGCFTIDFDRMPEASEHLILVAGRLKARGDREGAEALAAAHVDGGTVPQQLIAERFLRHPKASFVYALDLD